MKKRKTPEQVIAEIKREIRLRKSCYPKWTAEGKMTQFDGDNQIECLEEGVRLIEATFISRNLFEA